MFPNPQDALPLPPRPNLEQYKRLAKYLVKACLSEDAAAIREWSAKWIENLAKLAGLKITPQLPVSIERWVGQVAAFAARKLTASESGAKCALADAQFVIARSHGFPSWPKFAKHIEQLTRAGSPISEFEMAADAIVTGDVAALRRLLRAKPELTGARSTREHRATLLHYVSANGVEGYRQKTPKNAVQIARLLLEAGAEVDAEAAVYGGGATTLGLVATSVHPERAGVQNALMQLLLDHGARLEQPGAAGTGQSIVNGCLANGRGQAAEFLAEHGAGLDLEGAAGVGRLDVVKQFFNADGSLKQGATEEQMRSGFAWACEYGRTKVARFLLQKGFDINTTLRHDGQTGLHWAAYAGHVDIVQLLLERGASADTKDESFGGTPVEWALYGWRERAPDRKQDGYYKIVALLAQAGARADPSWLAHPYREGLDEKVAADPRMVEALTGKPPGRTVGPPKESAVGTVKHQLTLRILVEQPTPGVDFGLQKGKGPVYETVQTQQSSGNALSFEFAVALRPGRTGAAPDFGGPFAQGPAGARFVYLDIGAYAGQKNTPWSRRLKIPLSGITRDTIDRLIVDPNLILETRVPGSGRDGGPNCGTVKPFNGWRLRRSKL